MKNSDFLSWFNNLHRSNNKENILSSANNIISSLSVEGENTIINKEKYKFYLKVFSTQSEDLLYTINRLIGGICSTATDYREGFGITLQLFLDKFSKEINISELLEGIQKESYIPKNEKNNIRLAALSGKLFVYKILLALHNLSEDNLIFIVKQIIIIAKSQKSLEEGCASLIDEIFNKIFNDYFDIKKNKNNKLLEGIFKSLENVLEHKNNLSEIDNNLEFCAYFILMSYFDNIKGFVSSKIVEDFFDNKNEEINQPLYKYFCILLELPIKYQNINTKDANIFNFSLKYLYQLLIKLNNNKYAYKIWNILIDEKCVENFNKISSKNFESLIYTYSLFLIHNFFDINFTLQIFDESFFLSLTQFQTNKKIKYVINITDIISEKIENIDDNKIIEEYCKKCLNIFGNEIEGKYSPKTLKKFYLFLLRKISKEEKNKYINDLLNLEENNNIEEIQFNLNALKILYTENSNTKVINDDIKNKIISFFLKNYYSDLFDIDISFSYGIEEMTLNLILSLIKPEFIENKLIPIKSSKAINILIEIHKNIQKLFKEKIIFYNEDKDSDELNEELKSSYKNKYKALIKEEYLKTTKSRIIVKFGLILLFLYLKHPEDFEDDINDIIAILEHNFDKDWMKVFTALCLNLLHKGSPLINDVVMNEYKKMSSYIGKDGYDVIVEYLKDTKIIKNKKKFEDESNEMNLEENEDI
jgi:hypothetical protein